MDYVKPVDVASAMVETGRRKLDLSPVDLLIRGALAGSILAAATSLAITGAVQTGQPLVGALIFPVGLILIVSARARSGHRRFRPGAAALDGARRQHAAHAREFRLDIPRQSDRQRRLWRPAGDCADQFRHRGAGRRRRQDHRHRAGQDHRLRSHRSCRHDHGLRQGDFVQLDGLPRHCRGHDHQFDHRQDRLRLYAGVHLLRSGLRAHGGEHVHHPDRHDDGRQDHGRAVVAVEPDPGHARQSGRRLHLHRAWRSTSRTSRASSRRRWR